jgi:phosphoserine phosphatase
MPEVVVLDLDGTILSVNSFRHWVLYMLRARFPHLRGVRRLTVTLAVAKALATRKAGLIDHETLKWRLQRLWQIASTGDGGALERNFIESLKRFVRPELTEILTAVANGQIDAVMATAAAADYAHGLGRSLGFHHILATPRIRNEGEPSNIGTHKRDAVLRFIDGRGWQNRLLVLFTDHDDDLPLIRVSQTVYWFGAESDRTALERKLPGISLRPGAEGGEILRARAT